MEDHRTGFRKHNDEVERWHNRVPPGVPGAGWVVGLFFVFAVFVFTGWTEGWWEPSHNIAAPTGSHHMTNGVGH